MEIKFCKSCGVQVLDTYHFCPNCGKKVNEVISVTIMSQLIIYGVSLILPPLGLWPAFKYLKSGNEKAKLIGIVAVILTIISTIVTLWISVGIFNSILGGLGGGGSQINSLQNLGY